MNENQSATLGVAGSVGFVFLIGWLLVHRSGTLFAGRMDALALTNLAACSLGTIGGFSSLLAYLGCTSIRGVGRVPVYIAFLALAAVAVTLDRLGRRWSYSPTGRYGFAGLLALVLIAGLFDQTYAGWLPPDEIQDAKSFHEEARFVEQIESMPHTAMVFQLPYVSFPECPPRERMGSYDHLRGYVHSRRLHWSFGGMVGREGDFWVRQTAAPTLRPHLSKPWHLPASAASGLTATAMLRTNRSTSNWPRRWGAAAGKLERKMGFLQSDTV